MTDTILLVDDDADASLSLARALQTTSLDIAVERAATKAHALEIIEQKQPLVVVLDLCLDPQEGVESGFSTLKKSYQIAPHCRVIVLTGHGDFQYGIRALELGAASFLEKPADINHLKILIQDGLAQARIKQKALQTPQGDDSGIHSLLIGKSAAAIILKEEISYAAQNKLPVLLTGETGTGKSLCARTIHDLSSRSQQSFVRFQPGLQSSELVSSELFGHTKGAFTGATSDREGLLKSADSGTLFLDEIDELPAHVQVALLGALQDKCFRPLGSDREIQSNFRLIAASNADLETCVTSGKLRSDFYHRLAHCQIRVPPLRERIEDIPLLVQFYLKRLLVEADLSAIAFADSSLSKLKSYSWPGNVRELAALIENACYRAEFKRRQFVLPEDLVLDGRSADVDDFRDQVQKFKRSLVQRALDAHEQNQVQAASALGIDRSTLRRILLD